MTFTSMINSLSYSRCRPFKGVVKLTLFATVAAFSSHFSYAADSGAPSNPGQEKGEAVEWSTKSKELESIFIKIPDFNKYPKDTQEACKALPNLIPHGFLCYGMNKETGKTYQGRVEFRRASDKYHLIVKRQIGDRVEWGVARFVFTMGGTDPGAEHSLRLLALRWRSGDNYHSIRYEHIHRLNFNPESKFVGNGDTFYETLIMDPL